MASKMADAMFGNSPKLEREDGKVGVKKKDVKKEEAEKEKPEGENLPVTARHAMERLDLHHAQERDHHTHDAAKLGDKKELHERHERAFKEMHARHEKELAVKEKTPEMGKEEK